MLFHFCDSRADLCLQKNQMELFKRITLTSLFFSLTVASAFLQASQASTINSADTIYNLCIYHCIQTRYTINFHEKYKKSSPISKIIIFIYKFTRFHLLLKINILS